MELGNLALGLLIFILRKIDQREKAVGNVSEASPQCLIVCNLLARRVRIVLSIIAELEPALFGSKTISDLVRALFSSFWGQDIIP